MKNPRHCRFFRCSPSAGGFTLLELMIVCVIIGLLVAIAINITIKLMERGYMKTLESDLSVAYKASVGYHTDNPDGTVTLDLLKERGYSQSDKVSINIDNGTAANLRIQATHPGVTGVYQVGPDGRIVKP